MRDGKTILLLAAVIVIALVVAWAVLRSERFRVRDDDEKSR